MEINQILSKVDVHMRASVQLLPVAEGVEVT